MSTRTVWPGSRRPAWSDLLRQETQERIYTLERMYTPPLSLLRSGKWGFVRRSAVKVLMPRPPA
jgi:hypothetical protein